MMSSCARYAPTGVRPFPTWYASSAYGEGKMTYMNIDGTRQDGTMTYFLAMGRQTIFNRVDGNSVHSQLVRCSEDTNGDFLRRIHRGIHQVRQMDVIDTRWYLRHGWQRGSWSRGQSGQQPFCAWSEWSAPGCQEHWGSQRKWLQAGEDVT